MPQGIFVSLDADTLAVMKTEWQACLSAIATAHQSYSIAGRSFTRANLPEVANMLSEITYAQGVRAGTMQRIVYPDMSA